MKNWIELCFSSDFDDALLSKLNQFTEELLAEESTQSLGKKLKDTIAKQVKENSLFYLIAISVFILIILFI